MQLNKGQESAIRTICKNNNLSAEEKTQEIMDLIFDRSGQQSNGTPITPPKMDIDDPEYLLGFQIGKIYAEYMYEHMGLKPDLRFEIPDVSNIKMKKLFEGAYTFQGYDPEAAIRTIIVKSFDMNIAADQVIDLINNILAQQNQQGQQGQQGQQQGQQGQQQGQQGQQGGGQQGQQQGQNNQGSADNQNQGGNPSSNDIDKMNGDEAAAAAQAAADKAQAAADDAKKAAADAAANGNENAADKAQAAAAAQAAADKAQAAADDAKKAAASGDEQTAKDKAKEAISESNDAQQKAQKTGDKQQSQGGGENKNNNDSEINGDNDSNMSEEDYQKVLDAIEEKFGDDIAMRNTGNGDGSLKGNHVIDKNTGDEIRKELNAQESSSDIGVGGSDDVDELIKIMNSIQKMNTKSAGKVADSSFDGNPFDKQIKKIKASREGIINWKKKLEAFARKSSGITKSGFRKNLAVRSGIYAKQYVRDKQSLDKCVIYIDTSGSVNNNQTNLIPVMIGEISKIMHDCRFKKMDIRLFTDKVYDRGKYTNLEYSQVKTKDFGIDDVHSGGTSIDAVYQHIMEHYSDKSGKIASDVSVIVILTDVSGITGTNEYLDILNNSFFKRMFYVVYDDTANSKEVCDNLVKEAISDYSDYSLISLINFQKQMGIYTNENYNIDMKQKDILNEARLSLSDFDDEGNFIETPQDKSSDKHEEDVDRMARKLAVQTARVSGNYEGAAPEIISAMKEILPECTPKNSKSVVEEIEDSFYIDDDMTVWIHKDFDTRELGKKLIELSNRISINRVIGNVNISNISNIREFPEGFPREIKGDFRILNVPLLKSFKNAPNDVSGKVTLEPMSKMGIKQEQIEAYKEYLESGKRFQPSKVFTFKNMKDKMKGIFNNESVNESEIEKRISLGEKFLSESFPSGMGGLFRANPIKTKPQEPGDEPTRPEGISDEDYEKLLYRHSQKKEKYGRQMSEYNKSVGDYEAMQPIVRKNKEIFNEVIDPLIKIDWGDLKDSDITVYTNPSDIRDNFKKRGFTGINILTDKDNVISMVYTQMKRYDKPKIVYLIGDDGYGSTNKDVILKSILYRDDVYKQTREYFENIGINWKEIIRNSDVLGKPTLKVFLLDRLFWLCAELNGTAKSGKKNMYNNPENLDSKDLLNNILESIFGDIRRKDDYAFNTHYRTINFRTDTGGYQKNKQDFVERAMKALQDREYNFTELFSGDILKALLIGISIRHSDGYPMYNIMDIVNTTDYDQLVSMINSCFDVDLMNTALKSMSYRGKDDDKKIQNINDLTDNDLSKYSDFNPYDAFLLFPDKCESEYVIDVHLDENINTSVEQGKKNRVYKVAKREIAKAGLDAPTKYQEYDYKTGERKDKWFGTRREKNTADGLSLIDELENMVNFFKDLNFNNILKDVKACVDEYNKDRRYLRDNDTYKSLKNAIDSIKGYPTLILAALNSDPDSEVKFGSEIEYIIDMYDNLSKYIEDFESVDKDNYNAIIKWSEEFITKVNKIGGYYDAIKGNIDNNLSRALSKSITKTKNTQQTANTQSDTEIEYDVNAFRQNVNTISKSYNDVKKYLKNISFDAAPRKIKMMFGSKANFNRMVDDAMSDVLSYFNHLIASNDEQSMKSVESQVKNINDICDSIIAYTVDYDEPDQFIIKDAAKLFDIASDTTEDVDLTKVSSTAAQAV